MGGEARAAVEHYFIRCHGLYCLEDTLLYNAATPDKPLPWPEPHALWCISAKLPNHGSLEEDCIRRFLSEVGLHVDEASPGVTDDKRGVSTPAVRGKMTRASCTASEMVNPLVKMEV